MSLCSPVITARRPGLPAGDRIPGRRGRSWIEISEAARPFVVTGCLALAAWRFAIRRWFVYAVIVFSGGAIESWFGLAYGSGFYVSGGLVLLAGLALLVRFLRSNPDGDGESHGA